MFQRLMHVGNVVVDLVATVPALPVRGGDVLAGSMGALPGGGFNVMVAAARQGLPVTYAGGHGSGPFGDVARAALREAGIAVLHPPRSTDTGVVVTLVDDGGERSFVTGPEAVLGSSAAELEAVRPAAGDAVYLSGYGLLDPNSRQALVAWVCRLPGDILVALDPGPLAPSAAPDSLATVLERADWCTASAAEATAITGLADPGRAASALGGRAGVIVRTGSEGCVVAARGRASVVVPGFAVNPVDTTGAGDTHTGVFLSALASGVDPVDAARTANAAAALAVARRGPATAPTAAELAAFLAART